MGDAHVVVVRSGSVSLPSHRKQTKSIVGQAASMLHLTKARGVPETCAQKVMEQTSGRRTPVK